ncbi:hypothetical protein ROJ8625_03415 [Roseivivax jejudonensis]|uniref:DUF2306 domain-containing protein n=1 Tax=Roseivivax jejudonensis TaxID=1529041 RepID=A0A1X7A105_9RHOB|nr:DUF2306 domain-containing protein [Roseivivax jejudonensis]SLN66974.1 hypothetical protein ROJ8625_03415 [Roseivivax jejudonensis]
MNWAPLWQAGPVVASHAVAAIAAALIGPLQFILPKGTALHRVAGYVWVGAMAFVAAGSFAIHGFAVIGPFGPIHLLSALVLWQLWRAISHARAGRTTAHRGTMIGLYGFALILAGAFTLVPGRIMHAVAFGP